MKNTFKAITGLSAITAIFSMATISTHAQTNTIDAQDSGFYIGGNYGYLKVEGEDDFDDDKDVWQGVAGYKFNEWIAIEGSYIDFGDYGNEIAGAETDGYTAAIKGMLPLTERFSLYAKAGQLWSETDYRIAGISTNDDDESLFVGAGLSYALTSNFLLNAEYTVYDTELDADEAFDDIDDTNFETDLKQASIGVEYRF